METIAASPVTVRPSLNGYQLALPFVEGLMYVPRSSDECGVNSVHIERLNVGDKELYGNGIGTRLIKAAMRHALEKEPRPSEVTAEAVRLGMLNTLVRVAGRENVTVDLFEDSYGAATDRSLEEMFDELPFREDEPYIIPSARVTIDAAVVIGWELPKETAL